MIYPRNILLGSVVFFVAVAIAVICWLNAGRGPRGLVVVIAIGSSGFALFFVGALIREVLTYRRLIKLTRAAILEVDRTNRDSTPS